MGGQEGRAKNVHAQTTLLSALYSVKISICRKNRGVQSWFGCRAPLCHGSPFCHTLHFPSVYHENPLSCAAYSPRPLHIFKWPPIDPGPVLYCLDTPLVRPVYTTISSSRLYAYVKVLISQPLTRNKRIVCMYGLRRGRGNVGGRGEACKRGVSALTFTRGQCIRTASERT